MDQQICRKYVHWSTPVTWTHNEYRHAATYVYILLYIIIYVYKCMKHINEKNVNEHTVLYISLPKPKAALQ